MNWFYPLMNGILVSYQNEILRMNKCNINYLILIGHLYELRRIILGLPSTVSIFPKQRPLWMDLVDLPKSFCKLFFDLA